MYVCFCNAYREAEVRQAIAEGADTVEKAYTMLGRAPRCGRCVPFAQALIDSLRGAGFEPEAVS